MFKKPVNNLLRSLCIFALSLFATAYSYGAEGDPDKRFSRSEYIDKWKAVAIDQMERYGIPASITLAQAILESGDGNSMLAREANNHFGIKCHDWKGKRVFKDDDRRNECFRKYKDAYESFEDHSLFLKRSRYLFLYEYDITDYKSWARGLKKAGYATNPKYPQLLIRIIEENNLYAYDQPGAVAKKSKSRRANHSATKEVVVNVRRRPQIRISDNRIKYIISDTKYSPEALAEKFEMGPWQIYKYNDLPENAVIEEGELVYLQPKRNKNKKAGEHIVQEGESLRDVSQKYGVKIKKILKHSDLPKSYRAKPGDKLKLRR